ncbi:MAG: hypothetical protein J0H71_05590 [Rhizobiales bacterium]|nr:hypothetical protein [Hyphomicrobiales bacterium]
MAIDLHGISQAAFDLIVDCEVTSEAAYNKLYRRPTWPRGASGVTIGIGYDCGYSTAAAIRADWGALLPAAMVAALVSVAGLTGTRAQAALSSARNVVDVPWGAALAVFSKTSLPKYLALAAKLPNWEMLSPDCKGALVSLVYNRGASFSSDGDRYREMRNIRAHMAAERFASIPAELRAMKRIWDGDDSMRGLLVRRDREAELFERGMKAQPAAVSVAPKPPPAPPTPQPSPSSPPSKLTALFTAIAGAFGRK